MRDYPTQIKVKEQCVVRKDMDINDHERLSNITLRHKFVRDQLVEFDFYSASSLKKQSVGIHSTSSHYSDFEPTSFCYFTPSCCVLNGEATNTNFILFGLTQAGIEPAIYRT